MSFMPPTDSMFLLAESREHPMHVGGLQLFELPDGAGPDIVTELIETFRATDNISPDVSKAPGRAGQLIGQHLVEVRRHDRLRPPHPALGGPEAGPHP